MKRAIVNEYTSLEEKYTGFVNLLNYRLMNLCIKAEEASLLPIKVNVDGTSANLENVATLAKKNDYEFIVVPNYTDDMDNIAKSIAMIHPEFKQTVDKWEVESLNQKQEKVIKNVPFIQLTMPEVNDDRYDLLKETTDLAYDDCKARMEAAKVKATGEVERLLADMTEDEADEVKNAFEQLSEEWESKRDDIHEAKIEEIDNAYNNWLGEIGKKEIARMEDEAAHGHQVSTRINLNDIN
jgi:ribosome recycling factor